jgi:hypothetical protein
MLIVRSEQMSALASAAPGGKLLVPCAGEQTWIEIELLDLDDSPVAGERYRLVLPGGAIREGRLDDKGLARVDGLDPGTCQVVFPDLDRDAWTRLGS